jgi:hypothetical protein
MSAVFISYRRADSSGHAQALHRILEDKLGSGHVFMDVDDIEPGQNFTTALDSALAESDVVIVLIGRDWLDASDEVTGQKRLDNPDDYVRREIATALEGNLRVIPVLLDDAQVPSVDALPAEIRSLSTFNAVSLRHSRFTDDVDHLLNSLPEFADLLRRRDSSVSGVASRFLGKLSLRGRLLGAIAVVVVGIFVWWIADERDFATSSDRRYINVMSGEIIEEIGIRNTGTQAFADVELEVVLSDYEYHGEHPIEFIAEEFPSQVNEFSITTLVSPKETGLSISCASTDDYSGFANERVEIALAHFSCDLVNPGESLLILISYASIYRRTPILTIRFRTPGFSYERTFKGERVPCEDIYGTLYCRP